MQISGIRTSKNVIGQKSILLVNRKAHIKFKKSIAGHNAGYVA